MNKLKSHVSLTEIKIPKQRLYVHLKLNLASLFMMVDIGNM